MSHAISSYDLGGLALRSGEGHRHEARVAVPAMSFGGEDYGAPSGAVAARLDVSRATHGYALRLRFTAEITGPCMRCLEGVTIPIEVDAREVSDTSSDDPELSSPYVVDEIADLSAWARDEIALEVPARFTCSPDEEGRCPACGRLVDAEPGDGLEPHPDPRWAKLDELRE